MSLNQLLSDFETPRLKLRPLSRADAKDMYEIYSDQETMRYWSNQPVPDISAARALIDADIRLAAAGNAAFWAVQLKDSAKVIGKCTLMDYSEQNQRAEIGYILNRRYWRMGYMIEAVTGLIEHAFNILDLHRIEADTDDNNAASLAMLEKLGFQKEGFFRERWRVYNRWQNSIMLGLLRSDWLKVRDNRNA
jgi:RimJ/RimL family protein N-acetyltransferase